MKQTVFKMKELPFEAKQFVNERTGPVKPIQLRKKERMLYKELLHEWKNPEIFAQHNIPLRRNILLYGITGTGKTCFARNLASNSGYPFYEVNQSSIISSHLGETAKNINSLFNSIKERCILFFDEIDSLCLQRGGNGSGSGGAGQEIDRAINTFLICMESNPNIILVGATNRFSDIDTAVIRRFDLTIEMPVPDKDERENFIKLFAEDHNMELPFDETRQFAEMEVPYGELEKMLFNYCRSKLILKIANKAQPA